MRCRHQGYHAVRSSYDRGQGVLIFFWTCEQCGTRLREVRRETYRPHFDPRASTASPASRAEMTNPGRIKELAGLGDKS
jgi:hypothetical protein